LHFVVLNSDNSEKLSTSIVTLRAPCSHSSLCPKHHAVCGRISLQWCPYCAPPPISHVWVFSTVSFWHPNADLAMGIAASIVHGVMGGPGRSVHYQGVSADEVAGMGQAQRFGLPFRSWCMVAPISPSERKWGIATDLGLEPK